MSLAELDIRRRMRHAVELAAATKPKRHDHRQSLWCIDGRILWCYRCGAIRTNVPGKQKWTRPTGPDGKNPI